MTRYRVIQAAFNNGEFSEKVSGRADLENYRFSAETLENVILLQQGGFRRRPGFRYVGSVAVAAEQSRLFPFEFSSSQAYTIEAGGYYFRYHRDFGTIYADANTATITNGTFTSDITGWADQSTGTAAISHDATNGRLSLDGASSSIAIAEQAITTVASTACVLRVTVLGVPGDEVLVRVGDTTGSTEYYNDFALGPGYHSISFVPTGTTVYLQFRNVAAKTVQVDDVFFLDDEHLEIETPWADTDLAEIQVTQSNDTLYCAHQDYRPWKLERYGHTSWSLTQINFLDGPYFDTNDTSTTITPSATTGYGIDLTLSSTAGVNDNEGWLSTDVGRLVRIQYGDDWGYAIITDVTSTTVAVADVRRDFGATTAATAWRLGIWSDTTGWPRAVGFFESRLAFAGTPIRPQTYWLSQTEDFENMQPDSIPSSGGWPVEDDDAIARTIASNAQETIQWIAPMDQLMLGTESGVWAVGSSYSDEFITPALSPTDKKTTRGAATVQPVVIDQTTIYLQGSERRVIGLALESASTSGTVYRPFDMTIFAEHIAGTGGAQFIYQEEPHSIVHMLRDDGQYASLTYRPENAVLGWSRNILGGSFSTGDAVVLSMATIPGTATNGTDERDELWVIVKRTINGNTVKYIECQERDYSDGDDQKDMFFVDSGLVYDGAAVQTITGLGHLEGETVSILADGAVHPDRTIASGSITLDAEYSTVVIGLAYTHKFKSLKLLPPDEPAAMGLMRRVGNIALIVQHTLGLVVGDDEDRLYEYTFRNVSDPMDTYVPVFTGELAIDDFVSHTSLDPRIYIQGSKPVPLTVLTIVLDLDIESED